MAPSSFVTWGAPSSTDFVRKALYRLDAEAVSVVVELLRKHQACDEAIMKELVRTPKMRSLLAAARRKVDDQRSSKRPPRGR
jgi:hypothetical protein